jgi:hypothetical protein
VARSKSEIRTMVSDDIKHFLINLDPATGTTKVREFETDNDGAMAAYSAAERADWGGDLNIVLISSDSLATIEKTHSSYFKSAADLLAARR